MSTQTTETIVPTEPKRSFRDRLKRSTPNETAPTTKSIKDKVKGAATVLGVVTVAGVVAAAVAKKTSKDVVEESEPVVETPEES